MTYSPDGFVQMVANMKLWSWDGDEGPVSEMEEPSDGFLDSHVTLMQLIEIARKIDAEGAR